MQKWEYRTAYTTFNRDGVRTFTGYELSESKQGKTRIDKILDQHYPMPKEQSKDFGDEHELLKYFGDMGFELASVDSQVKTVDVGTFAPTQQTYTYKKVYNFKRLKEE